MKQVIVFVISVLVFFQIGTAAAVSDTKKSASDKPNLITLKKEMVLTKKYLVFPVGYGSKDVSLDIDEEFLDMTFVLKVSDDAVVNLNLHGQRQIYGASRGKALLAPINGKIKIRILKDATSIETYAFDGSVYIPRCMTIAPDKRELIFSLRSGTCEIESFKAHGLKSAWTDQSKK